MTLPWYIAETTFWHAADDKKILLSVIMAISSAGSRLLLPVRAHDKESQSWSRTSAGAPWNGSNPPTRICERSKRPWVPWWSSWNLLKIRFARSSHNKARVVQTLCWWGCARSSFWNFTRLTSRQYTVVHCQRGFMKHFHNEIEVQAEVLRLIKNMLEAWTKRNRNDLMWNKVTTYP